MHFSIIHRQKFGFQAGKNYSWYAGIRCNSDSVMVIFNYLVFNSVVLAASARVFSALGRCKRRHDTVSGYGVHVMHPLRPCYRPCYGQCGHIYQTGLVHGAWWK